MYEGTKLITSSRPQGLVSGLCDFAHVRSKLDYGCVVYGSVRKSVLESLDRVQNAALRTCLGAFRMSPVASLHMEAGELPIELRRQQLCLQYICKL